MCGWIRRGKVRSGRVETGALGGKIINSLKAEPKRYKFTEYTAREQRAGQQGRNCLQEDGGEGPQV